MTSGASPRSRRDRPAKPALSREAIVDAALAIVRAEGIDALTMRRLAQTLDTGPASLYVYVANRDELWDLVFDEAIGSIETEPTDPARWREQVHDLGDEHDGEHNPAPAVGVALLLVLNELEVGGGGNGGGGHVRALLRVRR